MRALSTWILFTLAAASAGAQVISTYAGTEYTFPQTTLTATQAPIGNISGVLIDRQGNAYISDINNHIILKVTPGGQISVFAGIGLPGYAGDGGAATDAALRRPRGMSIDSNGNIYIADEANHRVRKVAPNGVISTVAGTGKPAFSGDGGPGTDAALNFPTELAVDAQNNLYISDEYNHRIRRINASDGIIRTVAGNGTPAFAGEQVQATSASIQYPRGIAFDPQGNLYISDQYNHRIRRVDKNGVISTYAGNGQSTYAGDNGPATAGSIRFPAEIAFDSNGTLYIAEKENHVIRQVTANGTISTFAGTGIYSFSGDNGPARSATLFHPEGVAVDASNNVYIADSDNNRLRRVTNGTIRTIAGTGANRFSGDGGKPTGAVLNTPWALAIGTNGSLVTADSGARAVRQILNNTITTIAGSGNVGFTGDGGPAVQATFVQPQGVVVEPGGTVLVSDTLGQTIRRIGLDGNITLVGGNRENSDSVRKAGRRRRPYSILPPAWLAIRTGPFMSPTSTTTRSGKFLTAS